MSCLTGPVRSLGPVRLAFTTRRGGVSVAPYEGLNLGHHVGDNPRAVQRNRAILAAELGLKPSDVVWLDQVHSASVARVIRRRPAPLPATDAAYTTEPRLALAVLVADCLPVLLADPSIPVVAVAHAGRVGACAGIVSETVRRMEEAGAKPHRLTAWLGPCAAGSSYEVPPRLAEEAEGWLPGSRCLTKKGTAGIDLREGVRRQLARLGVCDIRVDEQDTITSAHFYSYRREQLTGRQAGIIWIAGGDTGHGT